MTTNLEQLQSPDIAMETPSVFERLETTFRASHTGRLAAIAIASFGMTSAAEAYTVEPAAAENVPTATDSNANHNFMSANLTPEERQCAKIAVLGIDRNSKNGFTMYHAGIRMRTPGQPRAVEHIRGTYSFVPLPDGSEPGELNCSGIQRWGSSNLQMQSKRDRKVWLTISKSYGSAYFGVDPENNKPVTAVGSNWYNSSWAAWTFNQCPDGKHWLKVRYPNTILAKDVQTGQFIAKHTYNWPVKVLGSCKAAARSARITATNIAKYKRQQKRKQNQ